MDAAGNVLAPPLLAGPIAANPPPVNMLNAPPPVGPAPDPQHGAAAPNNALPAPPSINRAPRRLGPSSSSTIDSAPRLLSCVAQFPFHTVRQDEVTYVIPDCNLLFYVLSEMDTLMAATTRFTCSVPDWVPYVSQLYISVLVYYRLLTVQNEAGRIDPVQRQVLGTLNETFDARSLTVPGPLVTFFQSLGAVNGPTERFGNYTFGLPSNLGVTQRRHYLPQNNLGRLLPNIILTLDQLMNLIARNIVQNVDESDNMYVNVFNNLAANVQPERIVMLSPNARNNPFCLQRQLEAFHGQLAAWRSLLPFNLGVNPPISAYTTGNNANNLSLWQIMGFTGALGNVNNSYYWFRKVAAVMQTYCSYFRSSVSIAAFSPAGIGAIYVVTRLLGTQDNQDALVPDPTVRASISNGNPNRYRTYPIPDVLVTADHPDESLETLAEQYGLLCRLNVDWDNLPANLAPTRANTCVGPIDALPVVRAITAANPTQMIPANIATYYHSQVQLHPR